MRKEIEVKARVNNLEDLIKNIEALGISLSLPIIQNDETFVAENYGDYGEFHSGKNVLRIRETNGKFLFTLKQPQTNQLDCIERESEVADPVQFREALLLMGYKTGVEIHKVRRKAKYKEYEICIDDVKELGAYVEVEKITNDESAETVQNELFEFLKSLGVRIEDREMQGYDTLIYNKQHQ